MKVNNIAGKDTGIMQAKRSGFSRLSPLIFQFFSFILFLSLCSCGAKSGHFRIEGRFTNFNQGEFYIYSTEGRTDGIDTIKVADGRFSYDIPLEDKSTFIIVFPNFSEQAVFGESGTTVKINGDASHLKEMEITGTTDNEKMTAFRLNANRLSPPEVIKAVENFVKENPASPAGIYLIDKYLIKTVQPDYAKAYSLIGLIVKADPDNGRASKLKKQLESLKASSVGGKLSDFYAKDVNEHNVRRSDLNGKVNVINVWSSWSYDSQNVLRKLRTMRKEYGKDLGVLSICIDARPQDCKKRVERDSIVWPVICDGKMWDTPLLKKFGLATVPGSLITDGSGKIIARNPNEQQMKEKIESILKK